MPRWLVEAPTFLYLILGLAGIALGAILWVRQERKFAVALVVVAGLIFLVWLLDFLIVTDRERLILHVKEMAGNVRQKDVDRIFSHISDSFHAGISDKKSFRVWVEYTMHSRDVTELKVWDFEPGDVSRIQKIGKLQFLVKGKGDLVREELYFRCQATFVLDPDGQWRLQSFELSDPMKDPGKDRLPLPF